MSVWSELKKQQKSTQSWANHDPAPKTVQKPTVTVENDLPFGTIALDLETGSVTDMWKTGYEFIRLSGYGLDDGPVITSASPEDLIEAVRDHDGWVIGHNALNFDLILLDRLHGLSILDLARADRIRDTKLLAFLADPPYSRTKEGEIEKMYSLQNTGTKYLGAGKMVDVATGNSILKELARQYGGFDKIPVDHPQYVEYLKRDVEVTRDLVKVLPITDYARREHKIAAIASVISMEGFRVDVPLLEDRIRAGEEKRETILTSLMGYGLPDSESSKAPHRTSAGIAAIDTAFQTLGVILPRSPKTGRPVMGKEVLQSIMDEHGTSEVSDLAEAIQSLNGIRTIYANIQDNLVGDRVHPNINLRQSSGRWSIQNPGLTVVGKRDGRGREREVFIPEEGHVLISCDLSQVDARSVAALSQDVEYLALFEPGRDLHVEMATRLFGTPSKRELAKAATHGINYGMRPKRLAMTTGMSLFDAETVIIEFEKNFPVLTRWQNKVRTEGETSGLLYNGFGRLMRIEPDRAFTQAPALMGQSTARDVLCEGLLRLWAMGGEDVIRMIRGVIHDEIVLSVPEQDVEEIERLVVDAMSFPWCPQGGTHSVQIMAGLNSRGRTWGGCYSKAA